MTTETRGDAIGRAIDSVIRFCLQNKLVVILALAAIIGWGLMVMPFDVDLPWPLRLLPRDYPARVRVVGRGVEPHVDQRTGRFPRVDGINKTIPRAVTLHKDINHPRSRINAHRCG